jgi:DNA replication protein DnaC
MNNQATIDKMQHMKLLGMARAFKTSLESGIDGKYTADEFAAHLVNTEWDDRYNRKLKRLLTAARFRYQSSIEQIDFHLDRNLDKNMVLRLSECDWVEKKRDIIVTGKTGSGKSFIATALAHQGCMRGFSAIYFNCSKLFSKLKLARADGTYPREITRIQNNDILVLDDFGLHPIDADNRLALLEIMEDRHGRRSTIIASQFPTKNWHDIIGEPTIADAICDRIIHNAFRINLEGGRDSLRKKYARKDND